MANERYIEGKHDSGHHDGKYSELKRIAETDQEIVDFWYTVWKELWDAVIDGDGIVDDEHIDKKVYNSK